MPLSRQTKISLLFVSATIFGLGLLRGEERQAIPFANNGGLKMLYDNRMYPQAVAVGESVHIVWRGAEGFPYCATYDLRTRRFSDPQMLLAGLEDQIDAKKYKSDHHFAPVIWTDPKGYLHTLFGCHRTPGIHLVSDKPGNAEHWSRAPDFSESISYPKVHRIYDDKTLVYSRYSGHLGFWQYHISDDGGRGWKGHSLINLAADPQDGAHAAYAGSYNTTAVSADGKRLHVAFIWKVEDPVFNKRYQAYLHDHTQRYNLYYLYVDLPTGKAFNADGVELELPLRKKTADKNCLVWDTDERVAAVGPSICLDDQDRPHFVLPVSEESPLDSRFSFVSRKDGAWLKSPITKTLHPFNASHLELDENGGFHAYLVVGSGEKVVEEKMDEYGWGQRVEEWVSSDGGANWSLFRDLTPEPGLRYQNVQFVSDDLEGGLKDLLLFYGWEGPESKGAAYLLDDRPR